MEGVDAPTLQGGRRRRGAGELAHGGGGARPHRRAEGGDHRRHREDGEVGAVAEGACRPGLDRHAIPPATPSRRSSNSDIEATSAILKDIGLVE